MESFKKSEFEANVGSVDFVQDNESFSSKGVLRGLHFQKGEFSQARCAECRKARWWMLRWICEVDRLRMGAMWPSSYRRRTRVSCLSPGDSRMALLSFPKLPSSSIRLTMFTHPSRRLRCGLMIRHSALTGGFRIRNCYCRKRICEECRSAILIHSDLDRRYIKRKPTMTAGFLGLNGIKFYSNSTDSSLPDDRMVTVPLIEASSPVTSQTSIGSSLR